MQRKGISCSPLCLFNAKESAKLRTDYNPSSYRIVPEIKVTAFEKGYMYKK